MGLLCARSIVKTNPKCKELSAEINWVCTIFYIDGERASFA